MFKKPCLGYKLACSECRFPVITVKKPLKKDGSLVIWSHWSFYMCALLVFCLLIVLACVAKFIVNGFPLVNLSKLCDEIHC